MRKYKIDLRKDCMCDECGKQFAFGEEGSNYYLCINCELRLKEENNDSQSKS
jgi:hypothetical protein